ncbi:HlyD family secretion protein [Asticcacaulis sp. EMRT-3]|uniref:HlyD family secretion protein n=1 Tax=Asticcacaulis sp. EMRT-3 TaxID=3040349 RepID=UPI0024AEA4B2|nr:HlyD family secretion protein [Asticcacaulis sp. EMRT-3]MDI7773936.1 HlyD family secretion protein [Asticcacaulis sp. EMRT-3]
MPDNTKPSALEQVEENAEAYNRPASSAPSAKTPPPANNRRRRLLTWLAAVVVIGVVVYGAYYLLYASHYVSTDNAYVGTDIAQVNALVAGPVATVVVSETQAVKAGDVLLTIDDSDAKIAVEQARADLALAQRHVAGYYASDEALAGQLGARQADVARATAMIAAAKSDLDNAKLELTRRQNLAKSGAVSQEELTSAQNAYDKAEAAYSTAQADRDAAAAAVQSATGQRSVNSANISGVSSAQNPEVLAAQAKLDAAQLALDRTIVRAPVAGIVSKKSVEVGQQVAVGTPLMTVVPTSTAYVDANFKEVQLDKVKPGQKVTLYSDLYGKSVVYHGTVRGLSGGTGSAFSLIPAQNASGNWIKVVQRLPVRIDLDPKELKAHPLRVGLSMTARIDTRK